MRVGDAGCSRFASWSADSGDTARLGKGESPADQPLRAGEADGVGASGGAGLALDKPLAAETAFAGEVAEEAQAALFVDVANGVENPAYPDTG